MPIPIKDVMRLDDLNHYKIHFAVNNHVVEPLDVFVRNPDEWAGWNAWRGERDVFSRKYIFSLIRYYHKMDKWLFGGIYEVVRRCKSRNVVILRDEYSEYIGRLLIHYPGPGYRGRAFNSEKHFSKLLVSEIFDKSYTGESFPGYEWVDHGFSELEAIFEQNRQDWKTALENLKGVYLISDTKTGKMYVGSAYNEYGIWGRWASYLGTGHYKGSLHGGNVALKTLLKAKTKKYVRKHFRFSILEHFTRKTEEQEILNREQHWKRILMSPVFGYNRN